MAKKRKFHFNPETLSYEPVVRNFKYYLKSVLIHLFSGLSLGVVFFFVFVSFVQSPEEKQLGMEKSRMRFVVVDGG